MADPGSRDVRAEKKKFRTEALERRDRLPLTERQARSAKIFERLRALAAYEAARTVAVFVSCRSEVDTRPVVEDLLKRGRRAAVPRVTGKGEMEFHRITDPSLDLEDGAFGLREPRPALERVPPGDIDLLIAPGAAFDPRGFRVGYGGGFFDRYLRRLRPDCPVVSLAFEIQIVDRVPAEPFDEPVGLIVTEDRVLRAAPGGAP